MRMPVALARPVARRQVHEIDAEIGEPAGVARAAAARARREARRTAADSPSLCASARRRHRSSAWHSSRRASDVNLTRPATGDASRFRRLTSCTTGTRARLCRPGRSAARSGTLLTRDPETRGQAHPRRRPLLDPIRMSPGVRRGFRAAGVHQTRSCCMTRAEHFGARSILLPDRGPFAVLQRVKHFNNAMLTFRRPSKATLAHSVPSLAAITLLRLGPWFVRRGLDRMKA